MRRRGSISKIRGWFPWESRQLCRAERGLRASTQRQTKRERGRFLRIWPCCKPMNPRPRFQSFLPNAPRSGLLSVTNRGTMAMNFAMDIGSKTKPSISVVVPVYNSELILPDLIKRMQPVLAQICSEYEVIFVNDASRDRSWNVIQEHSSRLDWVRGICLMRNYGQHNALLCGIRAARFEIIMTMDDDLQHPPQEIPKLLDELH